MAPLSVLVTGSSASVGTQVVRHLHVAGHRISALDPIPPKAPLPEGVAFHFATPDTAATRTSTIRRPRIFQMNPWKREPEGYFRI